MPCVARYQPEPNETQREADLRQKLDQMTELLCRSCQHLDDQGISYMLPPEVLEWWKSHQEDDRLREAEQLAALNAQNPIEPEDIRFDALEVSRAEIRSYLDGFLDLDTLFLNVISRAWDQQLNGSEREFYATLSLLHAEWTSGHRSAEEVRDTLTGLSKISEI
jgi:hypothetical protein